MNVLLEPDSEESCPEDAPSRSPDAKPELVTAGAESERSS